MERGVVDRWSWEWPWGGGEVAVLGRPLVSSDLTRHRDARMYAVLRAPGLWGLPDDMEVGDAWTAWVILWRRVAGFMGGWWRRLVRNSQTTDLSRALAILEIHR